jgi:hypothetical protein
MTNYLHEFIVNNNYIKSWAWHMVLLCITILKNQQKMTMNTNPGSLLSFALDE